MLSAQSHQGQNIALHASPAARKAAIQISPRFAGFMFGSGGEELGYVFVVVVVVVFVVVVFVLKRSCEADGRSSK